MSIFRRLFGKKQKNEPDIMSIFKVKYHNFKDLLTSNAEILTIISDMEEKLQGKELFGLSYIWTQGTRAVFHTGKMITSFDRLSGGKYHGLQTCYESICENIRRELEHRKNDRSLELILPYEKITKDMVHKVGGKNANLGEIISRANLPIPAGFAITTTAYDKFLEANDLMDRIRKQKTEFFDSDPQSIHLISENIQQMFIKATVPDEIESAIMAAYEDLKNSGRENMKIAMRSSAIGEDSELSFAGQYLTVLNVPKNKMIETYKEILASLFSPRAISYRLQKGIRIDEIAMSVACLEMIPGKASGVMFTRHPYESEKNQIIINAVWGLGPYAVDGVVSPDNYTVSKEKPEIIHMDISEKPVQLIALPDGDTSEAAVQDDLKSRACLTETQIMKLAEYGMKLEKHFGEPQDIEWVLDEKDNLIILQSRPLRVSSVKGQNNVSPKVQGYDMILDGGETAYPGIGCGPAFPVYSDDDLLLFPEGGVLIANHSSPKYVIVMQKAEAILADAGSITGHMASLAREFKVPAILNTRNAMSLIPKGMTITVDAHNRRIYAGEVHELLSLREKNDAFMIDTPIYQSLRRLADVIVPLNLVDPKSPDFTPKSCKTFHDIIRFIHELTYTEMFSISDLASKQGNISVRLNAPIPIDLYIIDLGGGIEYESSRRVKVTPDEISCAPFKSLLKGMLREDLRAREPRPVNFSGFFSVMRQQMLSPPNLAVERFGDRSYAIISDKYINFSSRVGYHYSILDAYCGQTIIKNYINFEFKGGAADDIRKNRRVRLIRKILEEMDFLVEVKSDLITARYGKQPSEIIDEKLDYIGRLLMFTRQMDMLMHSEDTVNIFAKCFLDGDYQLSCHKPTEARNSSRDLRLMSNKS